MPYKQLLEASKGEMLEFAQNLIRIPSVKNDPEDGAPFGKDVRAALDYVLDYAKKLGFETFNADGYAGHAECGSGDETLAILVHLDVVPEGDGWMYPPYDAMISSNRMYGRGALDNKGPAASVFFALNALKQTVPFNKKVRIIFGCDEESGWEDIEHYNKVCTMPDTGFSPDSEFPVVYAEKGIIQLKLTNNFYEYNPSKYKLLSLYGGDRVNVVPDTARAEIQSLIDPNTLRKAVLEYTKENDVPIMMLESGSEITLISRGKSAHGSRPELGVNAIGNLIKFLNTLDIGSGDMVQFISFAADKLCNKLHGEDIGLNISDEPSGQLTMNIGSVYLDEKSAEMKIDIRYPVSYKDDFILDRISSAVRCIGSVAKAELIHKPLYVPKDHELIKILSRVYSEHTGYPAEPVSMGGGTYARALKTGVAFGPIMPHMKANEHEPNEYIELNDLYKCMEIYADAIYNLACK